MSAERPTPTTVHGYLLRILIGLESMAQRVQDMRADLSGAYSLAPTEGRPTVQIRVLQGEFDALQEVVRDLIDTMTRFSAEIEARSRG